MARGHHCGEPRDEASHGRISVSAPRPRVGMPGSTAGTVIRWGGLAAVAVVLVDWPVVALVRGGTRDTPQHPGTGPTARGRAASGA